MTAFDPFAGEGRIAIADAALVEAIAAEAGAAQRAWGRADAKTRAARLHALASRIEAVDFAPVAELMSREMGKPYPDAVGELGRQGLDAFHRSKMVVIDHDPVISDWW